MSNGLSLLQIVAMLFVAAVFIVALIYAGVRAGSIAYFRTRLEYFRRRMKEIRGENNDGES